MEQDRWARLRQLAIMPPWAGADHRDFLDEDGKDTRLQGLNRKSRRKLKKETTTLVKTYHQILMNIYNSGAGYPIDQAIRHFAGEYTHRYASSGIYNQPLSFDYVEPFLTIHYIQNSFAPYMKISPEIDHLFFLNDFLDFATDSTFDNSQSLMDTYNNIPNNQIFNYTANGRISDNIYTTSNGSDLYFLDFHSFATAIILIG